MRGKKKAGEDAVRTLRKTDRPARVGAAHADEAPNRSEGSERAKAWRTRRADAAQAVPKHPLGLGPAPVEETITPAELASIPPAAPSSSSSGIDAAREVLEEPSALKGVAPSVNPEGVIQLAEAGLGVLCLFFSRSSAGRPLEDPSHFTEGEREMLRIFAPSVAPFLGGASEKAPQLSVAGFVGCLATILFGRYRALRAESRAKKEAEEKRAPPAPTKTRTPQDLEHQKRWGRAADAVPSGALPRDAGLPPRFQPKNGAR